MMIAILTAVEAELSPLVARLDDCHVTRWGETTIAEGTLSSTMLVAMASGVGKVDAASAAQYLISRYSLELVVYLGAAGSLDSGIHIGDIVVANEIIEYDFDVAAFSPSLQARKKWMITGELISAAVDSCQRASIGNSVLVGRLLTGDKVISKHSDRERLRTSYSALCVEMEGAAIAATCQRNEIPFLVIRVVSDEANTSASVDFRRTLELVGVRCAAIVDELVNLLSKT